MSRTSFTHFIHRGGLLPWLYEVSRELHWLACQNAGSQCVVLTTSSVRKASCWVLGCTPVISALGEEGRRILHSRSFLVSQSSRSAWGMSDLVSNKHINTSGDDCGAEAERCVPRQNTLAHKVVTRFKKKKEPAMSSTEVSTVYSNQGRIWTLSSSDFVSHQLSRHWSLVTTKKQCPLTDNV